MKKNLFIALTIVAVALVSCAKETVKETVAPEAANGTITFSASIDLNADTKASLSDHAIHWAAGDVIAVANDVNDDVEACAVTPDGLVPTRATFTATAVAGATTYYAVCVGDNITGITFDHTTGTFSGLNNPNHTFSKDAVTGARLAMAGKSTDKATIAFSPCLALIKVQIAAESVAAKYDSGYSGVRGLNLIIKHSGSRINPTGDYTVNLSGASMAVSYAANGANYIQVNEGTNLMDSGATYYLAAIPAGAVETFQIQYFGFDSGSEASWSDLYPMTLTSAISLDPGDYLNLGTLNPVGLQKAKDAIVPAITVDGDMSDWASITVSGTGTSTDALNGITSIKATADETNVYVMLAIDSSTLTNDGTYGNLLYFYLGSGSSSSTAWMWGTAPNTYDSEYTGVWLTKSGNPVITSTGNLDSSFKGQGVNSAGTYYYEFSLSRTDSHITALPAGKGHVGVRIAHHYYDWTGSYADYMYAPAGGSMLEIDLP